jgi:F0F1-type ATP synthase assembly protein I
MAGAVVGAVVGLVADGLVRAQGYWLVATMAGLIGGVLTVYLGAEEETEAPAAEEKQATQ